MAVQHGMGGTWAGIWGRERWGRGDALTWGHRRWGYGDMEGQTWGHGDGLTGGHGNTVGQDTGEQGMGTQRGPTGTWRGPGQTKANLAAAGGDRGAPSTSATPRRCCSIPGSAVCAFYLADVERAFEGPFAEPRGAAGTWTPVPEDRVPRPRYTPQPGHLGPPGVRHLPGPLGPHAGCAAGRAAALGWDWPPVLSPPGTSPTRRWSSPRSTRCCTVLWHPLAGGPSSPAPAPGVPRRGDRVALRMGGPGDRG